MAVEFERGYLILAHSNGKDDYLSCARALARSLRWWMPDCKICLITDQSETDPVFDIVKPFPHGDQAAHTDWKLANDWQAFHASPFRQTIKLEADMIVNGPIDHWWAGLQKRDVVVSRGMRNYLNDISDCRAYRRHWDDNDLPDLYNAITYWRLSQTASEFWHWVRTLFENWTVARKTLKYCDNIAANTDMIYAMVAKIMGEDRVTLPGHWPSIIHMKSAVNYIKTDARMWTDEFAYELVDGRLRINTVEQTCPVHYHDKRLSRELEEYYGRLLASRRTT